MRRGRELNGQQSRREEEVSSSSYALGERRMKQTTQEKWHCSPPLFPSSFSFSSYYCLSHSPLDSARRHSSVVC